MNVRTMATSGVIAALYVAVTFLIVPFGFMLVQFRVSEIFNHLVVFNKKYIFGIVIGVLVANFLFSPILVDVVFGVFHSLLALSITIISAKFIKGIIKRMLVNTAVFTILMIIIAYQLKIFADIPDYNGIPFLSVYLILALGEFIIMAIGVPIMYALNKRLDFKKLI
ncbi:QueT transporter family protein [Sporosarcina sp. 6E9]|uniref:QueT transporter family protein n=1 Tax=Sporosarcina sp. 6E9 TaxID=2819235 RepID=UPI001AC10AEA|nr:QueT transporter family protein [Sporosarcina sp. 6E9]MBO1911359.1 QueT transporter family protein [Microvirga sp. 3-52]